MIRYNPEEGKREKKKESARSNSLKSNDEIKKLKKKSKLNRVNFLNQQLWLWDWDDHIEDHKKKSWTKFLIIKRQIRNKIITIKSSIKTNEKNNKRLNWKIT